MMSSLSERRRQLVETSAMELSITQQDHHNTNSSTISKKKKMAPPVPTHPGAVDSSTTLARIYQAQKSGTDRNTVKVLKKQFQTQVELKMTGNGGTTERNNSNDVRRLQREKSFDEARLAVQSQIERIFAKAAARQKQRLLHESTVVATNNAENDAEGVNGTRRRYTMHGVSHLSPDEVVAMTPPLPTHHGITLQALLEKKRLNEVVTSPLERDSTEDVTEDTLDASSETEGTLESKEQQSFLMHSKVDINRHVSMDNLVTESRSLYARKIQQQQQQQQQYLSLVDLTPMASKRSQRATKKFHSHKQEKNHKIELPPGVVQPRDSNLQHLGRMTPEEQLDKFLQSVAEVNAENVKKLADVAEETVDTEETSEENHTEKPTAFNKSRNLIRETPVANRWKSADNLSVVKMSADQSPKKRQSPLGSSGGKATPNNAKKKSSHQQSGRMVGFREINGPKSFASLSQLECHSKSSPMRPVTRQSHSSSSSSQKYHSPMEVGSRTSSSTDQDAVKQVQEQPPSSPVPRQVLSSPTSLRTSVSYLGRMALSKQASDLSSLQLPLKELYFNYMETRCAGGEALPSSLEITDTGLKVNYVRERLKGIQEIFNPFPTIAVWAAVRFIYRREPANNNNANRNSNGPGSGSNSNKNGSGNGHNNRFLFAFLPLISDPGDAEKDQLFNPLSKADVKLAASFDHPAVFACIMRNAGAKNQLECHGFVCDSREDAIKIASSLYNALMETMKKQREQQGLTKKLPVANQMKVVDSSKRAAVVNAIAPRQAGNAADKSASGNASQFSNLNNMPQRPPRVKRRRNKRTSEDSNSASTGYGHNGGRKSSSNGEAGDAEVTASRIKPNKVGERQQQQQPNKRKANKVIERRSADDSDIGKRSRAGDIYTKVAMPRSKSFMNVSGQYNLQELFRELKEKEGIESVDDILRQVVKPDGMSFNQITPVYRELLMKLAMSLSADEMFIRSKNIMMQERLRKTPSSGRLGLENLGNRLLHALGVARNHNKSNSSMKFSTHLSKADISEPRPMTEEAKRELAKQWMKGSPNLAAFVQAAAAAKAASTTTTTTTHHRVAFNESKIKLQQSNRKTSLTRRRSLASESYVSCSECGYQSICGTNCSCSIFATTTAAEEDEDEEEMTVSSGKEKKSSSSSTSTTSILAPPPPPPDTSKAEETKKKRAGSSKFADVEAVKPLIISRTAATTPTASSSVYSSTSSCSTCGVSCQLCYSCSECNREDQLEEDGKNKGGLHRTTHLCKSHSIDDDGANSTNMTTSSSSCYSTSYTDNRDPLSGMDSPQTAWDKNVRHGDSNSSSSSSSSSSSDCTSTEEEESDDEGTSHTSVLSAVQRDRTAEHLDGFFRNNLSLVLEEQREQERSFQRVNATVAARQLDKKPRRQLSEDSLSKSLSSTDSSTSSSSSMKGPRPAYSEANMHNSLGYLP